MRGFTLLELVIVIAILGILTAVGMTSYTFTFQKSRDSLRKSDLALIAKGVVAWAGDFGTYPDDDGTGLMLACDPTNQVKTTGVFTACDWGDVFVAFTNDGIQTYIAKIPADPTGSQYNYYYKKTATGFSLFSVLENANDDDYVADAGEAEFGAGAIECGFGRACNYQLTEAGVK